MVKILKIFVKKKKYIYLKKKSVIMFISFINLYLFNFVILIGVAVIVAEVPEEHVYKAIKEICWRQLNPLLALVEVNFSKFIKTKLIKKVIYIFLCLVYI